MRMKRSVDTVIRNCREREGGWRERELIRGGWGLGVGMDLCSTS